MLLKRPKVRRAFIIYWILLAYIIAALIWWFIALTRQNDQLTKARLDELRKDTPAYFVEREKIGDDNKRKTAQYGGEGITFLLLILAGAVFVFRAVRRELKAGVNQQNFMMAVTHELKTPISVSKLNLETMKLRSLDDDKRKKLLQSTLEETERLDALCNNLLLSSQIDAGGYRLIKEPINLSEFLSDARDRFRTRYPGREFRFSADEDLFTEGDEFLIQIAVNNLIDNAVKYSPQSEGIAISVHASEPDRVEINIADHGAGLSAADRKRIFEKFYRTGNEATKRAKGTGLGLYIVKRIALLHDAIITIRDNAGGGTIFALSFKAAGPEYVG